MEKNVILCTKDFCYWTGNGIGVLNKKEIKIYRTLAFGNGYQYYNVTDQVWINSNEITFVDFSLKSKKWINSIVG